MSCEGHGLSEEGLEGVLQFEGYGTKTALYWFLGMEEGGGSIEQLRERAKRFEPVEDLHAVARIGFDITKYVASWRVMSMLTMAIQGTPKWRDKATAQDYQITRLGRHGGDTFLTELMPLPCPNINAWPYESIYPTKEDYIACVRPGRIKWLRSEISAFKPRLVICYGKGNWRHHEEIFNDVEFRPELDEKIRIGKREQTTVLLTPFLSPDLVTTALIEQMADLLGPA